jgi:hypothetical protein
MGLHAQVVLGCLSHRPTRPTSVARSVAMEIDLEDGKKQVDKPEFRLSPAEMDELKKHLSLLRKKELN